MGEWREEGEFAGGTLTLLVNAAGVIQWSLVPTSPKEIPAEFPTVGRFVDACEAFCPIVRRWFELALPLDRIAFGAVVLFPVATRRDGYVSLSQFLPDVTLDPDNARDFLFQINRRRPSRSGIKGLEINRLSSWSVAQLRVITQPMTQPSAQREHPPSYACRLELDMNTAPEHRGSFVPPQSAAIFDELVALAREILEVGDRP